MAATLGLVVAAPSPPAFTGDRLRGDEGTDSLDGGRDGPAPG
jgi:hypothetical protein